VRHRKVYSSVSLVDSRMLFGNVHL